MLSERVKPCVAPYCRRIKIAELASALFILFFLWAGSANADQSCVSATATTSVLLAGTLSNSSSILTLGDIPVVSTAGAPISITTFADLGVAADSSKLVTVFDTLGQAHDLTIFFFRTGATAYTARLYCRSDDVDPGTPATGLPRLLASAELAFAGDGSRTNSPGAGSSDFSTDTGIPWSNGAATTTVLRMSFVPFTMTSASSNVSSVNVNGSPAHPNGATVIFPLFPETQDTDRIFISANLNSSSPVLPGGNGDIPIVSLSGSTTSTTTYSQLEATSDFTRQIEVADSSGNSHIVKFFFFHTASGAFSARAYVNSNDVDPGTPANGLPRLIGEKTIPFGSNGIRTDLPLEGRYDIETIPPVLWNNGSQPSKLGIVFSPFTYLAYTSILCDSALLYASSCGGPVPGTDTDSDGTIDCQDICPTDPAKIVAGACGCGQSEADNDNDGAPNCIDQCLSDPNKTQLGECGCQVSDSDLNDNGAADCFDPTAQTKPSAPTFKNTRKILSIRMQSFTGRVSYRVEATGGRYRHYYSSTDSRMSLSKLPLGRWLLRYRIQVGTNSYRAISKFSAWRRILKR